MSEGGFPKQLFDRIDELGRLRHPDEDSLRVHAGSILAMADAAAAPFSVSHYAARHFDFAIDHLMAIRALIVSAEILPAYAVYTLLRAAVENVGSTMWLLSGTDATERVLRALQSQYKDAIDLQKADTLLEPHVPDFPCGLGIAERLDQVRAVAVRNNLPMVKVKKKDPWSRIVRSIGDDDQTKDFAEHLWKSCSAFAHGDEWVYSMMAFKELSGSAAEAMRIGVTASPDILTKMLSATLNMAEVAHIYFNHFRLPERGR